MSKLIELAEQLVADLKAADPYWKATDQYRWWQEARESKLKLQKAEAQLDTVNSLFLSAKRELKTLTALDDAQQAEIERQRNEIATVNSLAISRAGRMSSYGKRLLRVCSELIIGGKSHTSTI